MILDNDADMLFISDRLKTKYRTFYNHFIKSLTAWNIPVTEIQGTKDIWCRDYMPVQVSTDRFVQFRYYPDYLLEYPNLRTDSSIVWKSAHISSAPVGSELIVDGGNIVKWKDKVIMCDKVFSENPRIDEKDLIRQLEDLLQVSKIIFVPWHPDDIIGHADGMVRWIDNDRVLINNLKVEKDKAYESSFKSALHNAALEWEILPYSPPVKDPTGISARGIYINYLEMKQAIFMPVYGSVEDDRAEAKLAEVFKGKKIVRIESSDIARDGGVLNCISWDIKV